MNTCHFSPCRRYRYTLTHSAQPELIASDRHAGETLPWIMLNPSTADESQLDPTLRRVWGYTQALGFSTFCVLNLFAFRATRPADMKRAEDAIGPENDAHILRAAQSAPFVVLGWGNHGTHMDRDLAVFRALSAARVKMFCLRRTGIGMPEHPLYLPKSCALIPYLGRSGNAVENTRNNRLRLTAPIVQ